MIKHHVPHTRGPSALPCRTLNPKSRRSHPINPKPSFHTAAGAASSGASRDELVRDGIPLGGVTSTSEDVIQIDPKVSAHAQHTRRFPLSFHKSAIPLHSVTQMMSQKRTCLDARHWENRDFLPGLIACRLGLLPADPRTVQRRVVSSRLGAPFRRDPGPRLRHVLRPFELRRGRRAAPLVWL